MMAISTAAARTLRSSGSSSPRLVITRFLETQQQQQRQQNKPPALSETGAAAASPRATKASAAASPGLANLFVQDALLSRRLFKVTLAMATLRESSVGMEAGPEKEALEAHIAAMHSQRDLILSTVAELNVLKARAAKPNV
jgi:hypothetical protein